MAIINKILYKGLIIGSIGLQKDFVCNTKQCFDVNEKLLMNIINTNKNTEYGREHKFYKIHNSEDFRKHVPLGNYLDFEKYILKEYRGEKNILTKEDVEYFGHSSGTTGSQKLIPITKSSRNIALKLNGILCQKLIYDSLKDQWTYGRGVMLVDMIKGNMNSHGKYVTSASSGGMNKIKGISSLVWTSPNEVMEMNDKEAAFYLHVLFALKEKNLMYIGSMFISSILDFFRFIEKNHKQLVNDLEKGEISEKLKLDTDTRKILNKKLGKSPKRACEIRREFEKGFEGIASRLWKKLIYLACVTGANFNNYDEIVKYYTSDIPICSIAYAASEGFIGVNPYCNKIEYIIVPDSCFYEFIKLSDIDKHDPKTYFINELKLNEDYEIVLTTVNGLYRYRLGDVVRVVGFYNNTPKITFLFRKNMLLNMVSEKTTESHVNTALMKVIKEFNMKLTDYTTYADNSVTPGRYVFYLEIENYSCSEGINFFESRLDSELMKCNPAYARFRNRNRLQKLKVRFVKKGTFKKYRNKILSSGISANQIKIPRVIRDKKVIECL